MRRMIQYGLWSLAIVMVYSILLRQAFGNTGRTEHTAWVDGTMQKEADRFIVIDCGHGFFDAGKIGVTGTEEKMVNLSIGLKLRRNLEMQGWSVRMTREDDEILYDGVRPTDKKTDMKKRVALMTDPGCILAVSIHQNSFTEEKYHGAQVFYYATSTESQKLATEIQRSLIEYQDPENTRQEKANTDYYLLKNASAPTVICECGFLSHAEEELKLQTEAYQEKTAWAISVGIIRYLHACGEN